MRFRVLLIFVILGGWGSIFAENSLANPIIDSISPTTAVVGHNIHIYGQQFGEIQGTGTVIFNGGSTADQIFIWSENEIVCQVPDLAQTGCLTVTTNVGASNCSNIVILNTGEFYFLSGMIAGIPADPDLDYKDIRITAVETSGANLGNEIVVSEDGSYQMALFPGTYNLKLYVHIGKWDSLLGRYVNLLYVNGYIIESEIVISSDTNLDLPIPIHMLSGRITDESGTGIPDVYLSASPATPNVASVWSYTYSRNETGSEGNYSMYLVPETYSLDIFPPTGTRFAVTAVDISIDGNNQRDIVLEEQPLLSGMITGIPADPELDYKDIRITAVETSGANLGNEIAVSEDGSYQMALFPGTYDLKLYVHIGKWDSLLGRYVNLLHVNGYIIESDIVISSDTNRDLSIPIYVLSGRITDESGTGIPDVYLSASPATPGVASVGSYTYSHNETGSEGNYFMYLVPETYILTIDPPPQLFPPFEIQKLPIVENTTRDIVLSTDYSVLNDAIDFLASELELYYDHFDVIDQDQTISYEIPVTASRDEMEIVANWAGSELRVEIIRPDGSLYGNFQSQSPPISVNINNPPVGKWSCLVTAIDVPIDNYPIAIVAGITPNQMPIAEANGPYTGTVGMEVILDASSSYDPDGNIVRYEWDLDGDWIFDIRTLEQTISHTWLAPYTGSMLLRVTDDEGVTEIDFASVEVLPTACLGDFEPDSDVDGADLVAYILSNDGISLADFAGNYGKVNCQ